MYLCHIPPLEQKKAEATNENPPPETHKNVGKNAGAVKVLSDLAKISAEKM